MRLYEIPEQWEAILEEIELGCGEISEDIEAKMASLLDASKAKLEAAGMAKRNLELRAEAAKAQAAVFEQESARIKANAAAFEAAADRIGQLMIPGLEVTGKIKTAAGTLYTRNNISWAFALKPGSEYFELPADLWRQKEPELNKMVLRKLAEEGQLPDEISATKTENKSVILKTATPAKKEKEA